MDFLLASLFVLWCELLSLPLRALLAESDLPADVRRVLGRLGGPLLLALGVWSLGHLWGAALGRAGVLAWLALGGLAALRAARRGVSLGRILAYRDPAGGSRLAAQLALDGLTLALLLGFVAFRRWVPEMTTYPIDSSAAEKFMNMMLFWSSWHAPGLPPEDYWLAGHSVSYYYWGHFHWAWLGHAGGFPGAIALNLAFARAVTQVFEGAFVLARSLRLPMSWAAPCGVAVGWSGNPSAAGEWLRTWQASPAGYDWAAYNFWKPSRAIADSVIGEFPAFSAILGDFHAHHLALPWLLGWLALCVSAPRLLEAPWKMGRTGIAALLWIAFGLAAVFANLWNVPLLAFASGLLLLWAASRGWRPGVAVAALTALLAIAIALGARLLLGGDAQPLPAAGAEGGRLPLGWLPGELRSSLGQLFAMWGLPLAVLALAGAVCAARDHERGRVAWIFAGWGVLALAEALSPHWVGPAVWLAVSCWVVGLAAGTGAPLPRAQALVLIAGCTVVLGLEIVFVDDAYAGEHERYNTYFKLSYPLWAVFGVGAFTAARALWRLPRTPLRAAVRTGLLLALATALVYPACAVPARLLAARRGDHPPRRPTMNAVAFLAHRPPWSEEAPMLDWIRRHVPPGGTVAEGIGSGAYAYAGRVASLAGRPIPLGWAHHEGQWRGLRGHELAAERQRAVDGLYRATSPEAMRGAAAELGVEWVLYGIVERERYGAEGEAVLERLRAAAPVAAAFPPESPGVLLFDFRRTDTP
jgi:YYY domain-containing protein